MDFGKCSKSVKEDCSCCPLFSSLCFSSLLASVWLQKNGRIGASTEDRWNQREYPKRVEYV